MSMLSCNFDSQKKKKKKNSINIVCVGVVPPSKLLDYIML